MQLLNNWGQKETNPAEAHQWLALNLETKVDVLSKWEIWTLRGGESHSIQPGGFRSMLSNSFLFRSSVGKGAPDGRAEGRLRRVCWKNRHKSPRNGI